MASFLCSLLLLVCILFSYIYLFCCQYSPLSCKWLVWFCFFLVSASFCLDPIPAYGDGTEWCEQTYSKSPSLRPQRALQLVIHDRGFIWYAINNKCIYLFLNLGPFFNPPWFLHLRPVLEVCSYRQQSCLTYSWHDASLNTLDFETGAFKASPSFLLSQPKVNILLCGWNHTWFISLR